MNNRERNWYEGKHGKHPPTCRCPECEARRRQPYNDVGYNTAREDEEWSRRLPQRNERVDVPPVRSVMNRGGRQGSLRLPAWLAKAILVVVILLGLWLLPWLGSRVFTHPSEPLIWEPVALAMYLAVWIMSIRILRSRGLVNTSARSTARSVVLIFLALVVSSLVSVGVQREPGTVNPSYIPSGGSGSTDVPPPTVTDGISRDTGEYGDYYLGLVCWSGEYYSGKGCYNTNGLLVLINNRNASDPSYSELVDFLGQDDTDQFSYVPAVRLVTYYGLPENNVDLEGVQSIIDGISQPGSPNVCADFAERLHNNAELAGVRCAYVTVDFADDVGHACNAFQTTDRGLIYVDATGWSSWLTDSSWYPDRAVATVDIAVGRSYAPVSLFHEEGWSDVHLSMGTVTGFQVAWDGSWND